MSDNCRIVDKHHVALCARIAGSAHAGQNRRGGDPYIAHPQRVADRIKESNAHIEDEEVCILMSAAWLHDVLEDTDSTAKKLEEHGVCYEVIDIVETLTHAEGEKYADYIDRVSRCQYASTVKCVDIIDNLLDFPTDKQIKKYTNALQVLALN